MRSVVIIPARFHSTRLPGKPLVNLNGKPMILHVAEIGAAAVSKDNVYIATDDSRIKEAVSASGFKVIMTDPGELTGTDRVYKAALQVKADIYINLQGDEPLFDPLDIQKIIEIKMRFPGDVINGMSFLNSEDDPGNRNIPKVVTTRDNRLIYMSRLPIPALKENAPGKNAKPLIPIYKKQVCIYAYNFHQLEQFAGYGCKSDLEEYEDIEILRFLDLSIPVRMFFTSANSYAVDVAQDISLVEEIMRKQKKQELCE